MLRASASVAVVPGMYKERWFRRLGARASTTVTSHTSCSPISQEIMVTPSRCLPSVRYSPRGSSTEGKSKDPNVCFMRQLRVVWREKRPNVSAKIVVRKSFAPKAEAREAGIADNYADQTPRPPISAGKASWVLKISSKFTLHTLESPSRTVSSFFSKRTGWTKHVLVLRKYNNFGRPKQFFNLKKP